MICSYNQVRGCSRGGKWRGWWKQSRWRGNFLSRGWKSGFPLKEERSWHLDKLKSGVHSL